MFLTLVEWRREASENVKGIPRGIPAVISAAGGECREQSPPLSEDDRWPKINVDAALMRFEKVQCLSPLRGEARALSLAASMARELGWSRVLFQTDSLETAQSIRKLSVTTPLGD